MTPLVQAFGVSKTFPGRGAFHRGPSVQAVHGVDAAVGRGEAVGVVGESGSGKSTLGRLLLGLMPASEGQVLFEGLPLGRPASPRWRALRRRMQVVFQDPYGSLDPRRRVGAQISDGMRLHGPTDPVARAERLHDLLSLVGLDPSHAARFPHEFSGGQRQRIGIARALAPEPVSALDVSIQAQIVQLLARLRQELGLAMLFISHDLLVVRQLCDRVLVMYLGGIVEEGPAADVFERPAHPYTRALLSATPRIDPVARAARIVLAGDPPSPVNPPSGCAFHTRCPHVVAACAAVVPPLAPVPAATDDRHRAACIRAPELASNDAIRPAMRR